MTKSLFFFSFPFFFFLDLQHKDGAWESIMWLSITRVTGLWVTVRWRHMTKSHENHRKKVHRPYSSCISSVGKLMGTPSSSPCQLRLGVDLSYYSLRSYTDTKSLISWELLNIIICFNNHHKALFNALLSAINRTRGNKIPWRYKVLNVCI